MSYYPEPDSYIRHKVKILIDLANYATKKKFGHATRSDTSESAAKNNFIAFKGEVNKLHINKLDDVSNSFNNLKTKVHGLDVVKLKTVGVDSGSL